MKNTLENKEKFFAQYWGQRVLRYKNWIDGVEDRLCKFEFATNTMYIKLKPLSTITDEDLFSICVKDFNEGKNYMLTWEAVDYLRSKGYALPYMGLSVEKQIEFGWIKLIN